jgi:hydrogenase maturation protease
MARNDGRVFLAGVGNEFRRDDGVGLFIARQISQKGLPGVKVAQHQGEGLDLIGKWEGFEAVVLVDAVSSGGPPGTVYRIQMPGQEFSSHFEGCSTHAFSIAQTIALAKALQRLPSRLIIYGIEGASFEMGEGFSPFVREAADRVVGQILRDISCVV